MLAAIVTLASLSVLRWSWTPPLLVGSLVTLLPLGLTGHSSAGGSHDLATNSLLIHLVAASLWAGGLLALLVQALRRESGGEHIDLAARRFSAIALWCWVAMALSGVVNGVVRVLPSDLLTTDYGRLVVAKFVALCALGILGWRQRRTGVAALQEDSNSRKGSLIRLALIEAAVFGLTFGIAVGLGRTPPPPPPIRIPSIPEAEIGYDFDGPPTLARVLFDWRFDLIFGTAAIVFAVLYCWPGCADCGAAATPGRRAGLWPGCWAARCCCSRRRRAWAVHAGDVQHAHGRPHGVVDAGADPAGAGRRRSPWRLRALPAAGRDDPPGMREWLLAALHSRLSRLLTNPLVATVLFVAGFYGLYFGEHLRRRGRQPRRPPGDERALPAERLPVLLGGDRCGPDPAADPAAGQGGGGLRVAAVARVLRGRADEHAARCWAATTTGHCN